MNRKNFSLVSVLPVLLLLAPVRAPSQTPGRIAKFDASSSVVDSVIAEDASGNIGIGTTTPTARLDVTAGNVNLENSTATSGNILKGGALFLHNFGAYNTFLGQNAGNLTMTGGGNTAIGVDVLSRNTTGYRNTATGWSALYSNTTGRYNIAIGDDALFSNTEGYENLAMGTGALYHNISGWYNTASGLDALENNTTGAGNTGVGKEALFHNSGGNLNTAIGYAAGVCSACGNLTNATAIGANAVVNASNKIRLGNDSVTVIEARGDFHSSGGGNGIILKSPDGTVCKRLSIDNFGNLVTAAVTCP